MKHYPMRLFRFLSCVLFLSALSSNAQLFIDAGGPRDVFYGSGEINSGLAGFHAKIDTSKKALEGTLLGQFDYAPGWLFGGSLKASAVDGLEQFFRFERWPKTELNLLANKTWKLDLDQEHALIYSTTLRINGSYAEYGLFDSSRPAGEQLTKEDFLGGEVAATFSVLFPNGRDGMAFTVGYRRDSNYEDLSKATVGRLARTFPGPNGTTLASVSDAQAVRVGELQGFNGLPLTLLYSHRFDQLDKIVDCLPDWEPLEKLKKPFYSLLVSPYVTYVPRDAGKTSDSVGINFVVQKYEASKDPNHPEKDKLSFPIAVFVERKNTFSGEPDMKVGAAVIYHFK